MYCSKCGQPLPDDANFCMKCGTSLKAPVQQSRPRSPVWEICDITHGDVTMPHPSKPGKTQTVYCLWARALGPDGETVAAWVPATDTSAEFFQHWPGQTQKNLKVHAELVQKLLNDGWQPAGRSPETYSQWYALRFQREVSPERLLAKEQRERANRTEAQQLVQQLRAQKGQLQLTSSGDIKISGIRLSKETDDRIKDLKQYIVEILRSK